jgi:hypothetical protein
MYEFPLKFRFYITHLYRGFPGSWCVPAHRGDSGSRCVTVSHLLTKVTREAGVSHLLTECDRAWVIRKM